MSNHLGKVLDLVFLSRLKRHGVVCLYPAVFGVLAMQVACVHKPAAKTPNKTESEKVDEGRELNAEGQSNNQFMDRKKQILYAQVDLSSKLGITKEALGLPSVQSVTWRSGAIGCPEKGTVYTQALVPGLLMLFRYDNETYRYHAKRNGRPFHCPNSRAESVRAAPSDI